MMRAHRSLHRFLLPALVIGFAPTRPAQAQAPTGHHGVHFSIGAGASSVAVSCVDCGDGVFEERSTGVSGFLQLGGYVTPRLVIAGELSGWMKNDAIFDRRTTAVSLVLLGYPSATSGFFFKGAIGGMRTSFAKDGTDLQTDVLAPQLGIGYDIRLGTMSMTPYANAIWNVGGSTRVAGEAIGQTIHTNALQVGMAFTVP